MSGCGSDPSCITRRGGGGCPCGDIVRDEQAAKEAPRTTRIAHRAPNEGGVVSGVIRKLLGPQIEETRSA